MIAATNGLMIAPNTNSNLTSRNVFRCTSKPALIQQVETEQTFQHIAAGKTEYGSDGKSAAQIGEELADSDRGKYPPAEDQQRGQRNTGRRPEQSHSVPDLGKLQT